MRGRGLDEERERGRTSTLRRKRRNNVENERLIPRMAMQCSRCSSGYEEQRFSDATDELTVGDELDEIRKRFGSFEQRVEALERNVTDRMEAMTLATKIPKTRDTFREARWRLANSTTIHGLKELLTETHKLLRPAWMLIFAAAMASSALFISKVVREYMKDPTATKVRILRQHRYDYPIMLLCPDTWLDAEKAFSMNLSEAGLQYALGFVINYGVHKAPYTIQNYKKAKGDFEKWWYAGNGAKFENLADLFKYLALDSDAFVTNCSYCPDVEGPPPFAKIIMNEGVCYNLSLASTDGRVSLSDLEYLHVKIPMLSKGYLAHRSYWRYIVNPDLSLGMSDTHYLQVFPNHSNTIRVMPHHFESLKNAYCVTLQEVQDKNYSQSACVANCFMTTRPNKCRPYPLIRSDMIPKNVSDVCNTAQWVAPDFQEERQEPAEEGTQILVTPNSCIEQCPSLCEKWVFENSVEAHKLESHEDETDGLTSFHFLNQIVHYGGILSHEEVPTYSFETLVSNVGGQLGLWLGASLMSLIELVMFVLQLCCDRREDKRRTPRAIDDRLRAL